MRARRKNPGDVRVTIETGLVADVVCALNLQGRYDRSIYRGTRVYQESTDAGAEHQRQRGKRMPVRHL